MNIKKTFSMSLVLLSALATQTMASHALYRAAENDTPLDMRTPMEKFRPEALAVIAAQNTEIKLNAQTMLPRGLGSTKKGNVSDELSLNPAQECVFTLFTENGLPEVTFQILSYLPLKDLAACSLVNRNLRGLLEQPLGLVKPLYIEIRLKNQTETKYRVTADQITFQEAITVERNIGFLNAKATAAVEGDQAQEKLKLEGLSPERLELLHALVAAGKAARADVQAMGTYAQSAFSHKTTDLQTFYAKPISLGNWGDLLTPNYNILVPTGFAA